MLAEKHVDNSLIGVAGRFPKSLVCSITHIYIELKVSHLKKCIVKELRGLGRNYVQLSFKCLIKNSIWPFRFSL